MFVGAPSPGEVLAKREETAAAAAAAAAEVGSARVAA